MIYFKVIAILFTFGAGLLQIGLEYKWHDKRTKEHKRVRYLLVGLMILGWLSASFLVVYDDIQSAKQLKTITDSKDAAEKAKENAEEAKETAEEAARAAEERELKAVEAREQIKKELEALQEQIKPVVALATAKYPSLDVNSALLNLANDVQKLQKENEELRNQTKELKKQTKDLSDRDYFHSLNSEIRSRVVRNLTNILESYRNRKIQITVICESGNTMRQRVTRQLVGILSESGIETKGPIGTTTFSRGVLPAVRLELNKEDKDIAMQLARALNPYLNVRFSGKVNNQNEPGKISLEIYGNPLFTEDGVVTFP